EILDVSSISDDDQNAAVLFGTGGGQFGVDSSYALPFPPGAVTSGDFIPDGRIDLVVAGANTAMLALLANDPATGVSGAPTMVSGLGHPSPNPAASISRVAYRLARPGHVALRVYNVQGQLVRDLVDSDAAAGEYAAAWDGKDRSGVNVGPGVYFFRLESGTDSWREKLILLR
ncbi:MAG TPA: FlgD immunoglobulin-like domain containing protein, partial [Candidatus Eisenbacteria bacterium]|nr:FlgD immunoglobulin-like domain containing protein [Candidatus Eisenbacteria bacterium]